MKTIQTKKEASECMIELALRYPIMSLIKEAGMKTVPKGKIFLAYSNENDEVGLEINPAKNNFKCLLCKQRGNVIQLAMHIYSVNYIDAVEMLQN